MIHKINTKFKRALSLILSVIMTLSMCFTYVPTYATSVTDDMVQTFTITGRDFSRALANILDDNGYLPILDNEDDEDTAFEILPKVRKRNVNTLQLRTFIIPDTETGEITGDEQVVFLLTNDSDTIAFAEIEIDGRSTGILAVPQGDIIATLSDAETATLSDADDEEYYPDIEITESGAYLSGNIVKITDNKIILSPDMVEGLADGIEYARSSGYIEDDIFTLIDGESEDGDAALVDESDNGDNFDFKETKDVNTNLQESENLQEENDITDVIVSNNDNKPDYNGQNVFVPDEDSVVVVFDDEDDTGTPSNARKDTENNDDDYYIDDKYLHEDDYEDGYENEYKDKYENATFSDANFWGEPVYFIDTDGTGNTAFITVLSEILSVEWKTEGRDDQWYTVTNEPVDTDDMVDEEVYYMYGIEKRDISPYGIATFASDADDGDVWSFDVYYVNEGGDKYYIKETEDFNLKYQMEFHTSEDLDVNTVQIKIPATLFTDRNGNKVRPDDKAVPEISMSQYREFIKNGYTGGYSYNASMPFNCYVDSDDNIVFFNYRQIDSGTNLAWQVLYKNLEVMDIIDMTEWSLQPEIAVEVPIYDNDGDIVGYDTQTAELAPLTGLVDTYVYISSVSKEPYYNGDPSSSYTPGLYTDDQIEEYITYWVVDKNTYLGSNVDNYSFIVWDVKVHGNGSQPYSIEVLDSPTASNGAYTGTVIGYKAVSDEAYFQSIEEASSGSDDDGYTRILTYGRENEWATEFYVVTAYKASEVKANVLTKNDITIKLIPYDRKDTSLYKSADASWSYQDYTWVYPTGVIGTKKYVKDYANKKGWVDETRMHSALEGYLAAYRNTKNGNVADWDGIEYYSVGTCNNSYMTHYVVGGDYGNTTDTTKQGEYMPGYYNHVMVTDDFVYAYPSNGTASTNNMLDYNDYYFSSVEFVRNDTAWDIWQNKAVPGGEHPEGIDQTMTIYAMFKGSSTWEKIDTVDCSSGDTWTYTFKASDLAREPWRVKAEYNTVSMYHNCDIYVTIALRGDSSKLQGMMFDSNGDIKITDLQVENICGITGRWYSNYGSRDLGYFHDSTVHDDNYSEPGLQSASQSLYGTLPMRDSAIAELTDLSKEAASFKTSSFENDPENNRTMVTYNLTAFDGYLVYTRALINTLKSMGTKSPDRKYAVFYDLLPLGMKFDTSYEPVAGRVINMSSDAYQTNSNQWDKSETYIIKTVVTNDWRDTGRTMLEFHLEFTGDDGTGMSDDKWFEGWGVSFRAYYSWADNAVIGTNGNVNIAAFMPDYPDGCQVGSAEYYEYMRELCGTADEVGCDDGVIVPNSLSGDWAPFTGGDLNEDGITNIRNVLYMEDHTLEDVAIASNVQIQKLVKADTDVYDDYDTEAHVHTSEGYTYQITIYSSTETSNIIFFDRLEYALYDRDLAGDENPEIFEDPDGDWNGTFAGIDATELEFLGINPVIYYNTSRDAELPKMNDTDVTLEDVQKILSENGWIKESEWGNRNISDVKAVAIDCTKMSDGNDYTLPGGSALTVLIHMTAPNNMEEHLWAYNNASYYSTSGTGDEQTSARTVSDSVRVYLDYLGSFEIVKEFDGEVPEQKLDTAFDFTIIKRYDEVYDEERDELISSTPVYFSLQDYDLYELNSKGTWIKTGSGTTDFHGGLSLKAGQKAVFNDIKMEQADALIVEEEENVLWGVALNKETVLNSDGSFNKITWTACNTYHPPLFVQKLVTGVPWDLDESINTNTVFHMQVLYSENGGGAWEPLSNQEYWYTNRIRIDGGTPEKLSEGRTNSNGEFTIKYGDILAFFMPRSGVQYKVVELTDYTETDWICQTDEITGTMVVNGNSDSITNIYRWKNLYLTKDITHQSIEDAQNYNYEFTFRIEKILEDGTRQAESGNYWYLTDENEETLEDGYLNSNGEFTTTNALAGRTVTVRHLEAQHEFVITEVIDEEWPMYIPTNSSITVEMPLYSSGAYDMITNDWQMRPLTVTKMISRNDEDNSEDANEAEFTFLLLINGEPAVYYPYSVVINGVDDGYSHTTNELGQFTLKDQQSAVFQDIGYLNRDSYTVYEAISDNGFVQIYPADASPSNADRDGYGEPSSGMFVSDGEEATFINGRQGILLVEKEYTASNSTGQDYVDALKSDSKLRSEAAVTITITGDGKPFPRNDITELILIDNWSEDSEPLLHQTWEAGTSYVLEPGITMVIPADDLKGILQYTLTESSGDQHKILEWTDGKWVEITQAYPENDEPASGTIVGKTVTTLVNNVEGLNFTSLIAKHMSLGSDNVVEGARLIWRVERYDGGDWIPAEGVRYIVFDDIYNTDGNVIDRELMNDRVQITGSDGLITLTKTENGFPLVQFIDDEVRVNLYENMDTGDLRVVEILNKSDEYWGRLVGYGTVEDLYGYDSNLSPYEASSFVNSNRTTYLKVEKITTEESDDTFTFTFNQVTSISDDNTINETVAASEILYNVYDSETNEFIRTGITTKNGEFTLKAGEYAIFELPDNTVWTITEATMSAYDIESIDKENDAGWRITQISDDTMLIRQRGDSIYLLSASITNNVFEQDSTLDKDRFDVYMYSSMGDSRLLSSSEFTTDNPTENRGVNTVTITYIDEDGYSATTTVTIRVVKTVDFTGTVNWSGDSDNTNDRPASITLELYQDNVKVADTTTTSSNNWKFDLGSWRTYDENGSSHTYTIKEILPDGVNGETYSVDTAIADNETGVCTVTNKYLCIKFYGTVEWDDNNNSAGQRPTTVKISLYQDGKSTATKTVEANSNTNWEFEFGYYNPSTHTYSISVTASGNGVNYYENTAASVTASTGKCTITYKYNPPEATLKTGSNVNAAFKQLSGSSSASYSTSNTSIKSIQHYSGTPNLDSLNWVDISSTVTPVYAWYSSGTIYWWSEVSTVYMNANSSHFCHNMQNLTDISGLSGFDTSKLTDIGYMFACCNSLSDISTLSKFDTSSVVYMDCVFSECYALTSMSSISAWNTSKVTTVAYMFYCSGLTSADLSKWDTSNVIYMYSMFDSCSSLKTVNVTCDVSKVTNTSDMFYECESLTTLTGINSWNTSNLVYIEAMFNVCMSLTSLDLSGWDTSKVTSMAYAFAMCEKMTSLNVANWDTSNVTNMAATFNDMPQLTSLDLSNWTTSKVTNFRGTFSAMNRLRTLNISKFTISSSADLYDMFIYTADTSRSCTVTCTSATKTAILNGDTAITSRYFSWNTVS